MNFVLSLYVLQLDRMAQRLAAAEYMMARRCGSDAAEATALAMAVRRDFFSIWYFK